MTFIPPSHLESWCPEESGGQTASGPRSSWTLSCWKSEALFSPLLGRRENRGKLRKECWGWIIGCVQEREMLTNEGLFGDDVLRHLKEDENTKINKNATNDNKYSIRFFSLKHFQLIKAEHKCFTQPSGHDRTSRGGYFEGSNISKKTSNNWLYHICFLAKYTTSLISLPNCWSVHFVAFIYNFTGTGFQKLHILKKRPQDRHWEPKPHYRNILSFR